MTTFQLKAQTSGSVSGVVKDQTGAAIPDANLVLRNVATGESHLTTAAANGDYNFPFVEPGNYELTAAKAGFDKVVVSGLVVKVNNPLHQDIAFSVAKVSRQVNVLANAVQVDTEDASLGAIIGSKTITQLPLNGRDFLQLATLGPGVFPPMVQNGGSPTQAFGGGRPSLTVSISGSRETSPTFLFDGIPSRQDYYGAVGVEPPVDSILEFRIQQGYFSPQFGTPGVINVVLKSGTNDIHGAVWEFFRNDVLDAQGYFNTVKAPYRQNQFGINLGGPAIKNKLFWFGDYEGLRITSGGTQYGFVPTTAMLQGNFTGLPTIYDPSTYNPTTGTRQPFPGNQIPVNSSFAKAYLQFIPAPNIAPIASQGGANLIGQTVNMQDDNKFDVKINYVPSDRNTFIGEYNFLKSDQSNSSIYPYQGNQSPLSTNHPVFGWTHVFSPTVVNDFRAGLNRVFLSSLAPEAGTTSPNWAKVLGLNNLSDVPQCNSVPAVNLSNFASYGFAAANCIITGNSDTEFIDNLAISRGRHLITLGGKFERHYLHDLCVADQDGSFSFTGQYTNSGSAGAGGSSVADFLLGDPYSAVGTKFVGAFYRRGLWPDAYINDDFKAKPNLTINLGLRWQFTQPVDEKYNNMTEFNYQTGQIIKAGTPGYSRRLLSSHYLDFAPRVGFSYSPRPNLALRGSYGVFYDRLPGNEWSFQTASPPVEDGFSFVGGAFVPTINIPSLFPSTLTSTLGAAVYNLSGVNGSFNRMDPYLQQWTLSLEQTLPANMIAQIAFIGSKGTHLSKRVDTNLDPHPPALDDDSSTTARSPYPNFGFILDDRGQGNSEYDSLQLSLNKDFSHGILFRSGYTWGRSMDNDSNDTGATRNYRPQDMDHARSTFDVRNRFVGSVVYALPFLQNRNGLVRETIGGWQLSVIAAYQTGLPFYVSTYEDPSNTGVIFGGRPNVSCDGNLPRSQQTPQRWFNTSCYSLPPFDTYGNGKTNYLNTNGSKDLDIALSKTFKLPRTSTLQFRSEFFNVLNYTNFAEPGSYLDGGGFGVVSGSEAPRIIQFALKLEH